MWHHLLVGKPSRAAVAATILCTLLSGCVVEPGTADGVDFSGVVEHAGSLYSNGTVEAAAVGSELSVRARETSSGATVDRSGRDRIRLDLAPGVWDLAWAVDASEGPRQRIVVDREPPRFVGAPVVDRATLASPLGLFEDANGVGSVGVRVAGGGKVHALSPEEVQARDWNLTSEVLLEARDAAGNTATAWVLVHVPPDAPPFMGTWTAGVATSYDRAFGMHDLQRYIPPDWERRAGTAPAVDVGAGNGTDCLDRLTDAVVPPDADPWLAAWLSLVWMQENLLYDERRVEDPTLLTPCEVYARAQPAAEPTAPGAVCRDLARFYVELLRAQGIPARLVAGYVGRDVDGFHAWAEFQVHVEGGAVWVPVDVSNLARRDDDRSGGALARALAGFGIEYTEDLPLTNAVDDVVDWWTAIRTGQTFQRADGPSSIRHRSIITAEPAEAHVLCGEEATLRRLLLPAGKACPSGWIVLQEGIARDARLHWDYGFEGDHVQPGTHVHASLLYPRAAQVPSLLAFSLYGADRVALAQDGRVEMEVRW